MNRLSHTGRTQGEVQNLPAIPVDLTSAKINAESGSTRLLNALERHFYAFAHHHRIEFEDARLLCMNSARVGDPA